MSGNRFLGVGLLVVTLAMLGLAYASVPLYRAFCRATGFEGTTQRAEAASGRTIARTMTVRFNANVSPVLPWRFSPDQRSVEVQVGVPTEVSFHAENRSAQAIVGTALFNVTPETMGKYFVKTQCFCFTQQRLEAGERVAMPVYFYIDPAIADDPAMGAVTDVTLSYTFFRAEQPRDQAPKS